MARSWRLTGALTLLMVVIYGLFRAVPHDARIGVMREDGLGEYVGAVALFTTAVLLFLAFRQLRRRRAPGSWRMKPFLLLFMAAVFLLAAGEEMSWGQRIFGISTPEALVDANRQQETNLHNLEISNFDEYRLFTLFWYPYVLVLPALAAALPAVDRLISRILPTVASAAWPFGLIYLVNDVVSWVVAKSIAADGGFSVKTDFPRVELRETLFAVLTTLTAYLVLRTVKGHYAAEEEGTVEPDPGGPGGGLGDSNGLVAR